MKNKQDKVGFIGLGVLGSAIVPNLVNDGFAVVGYDVEPQKMDEMAASGMEKAASPKDVAAKTDAVITCLPTIESLHQALGGEDGINKYDKKDQIVIEISTFPVAEKEKARDTLARAGKIMLDCPVSGNRIQAQQNKLTAYGSGDKTAFRNVEHIINGFASRTFYIGEFGSGMKMKFCGNILNLVHNAAAAEVMVLGIKSGLDPKIVHEVISGSASGSAMFEVRGKLMAENKYDVEGMNFSIPIKDARFITEHAARLRVPLPIYQVALQSYYAAIAQGFHDWDAAAVCRVMERAANVERKE